MNDPHMSSVVGSLSGLEGGAASINGTRAPSNHHSSSSNSTPACVSLYMPNGAAANQVAIPSAPTPTTPSPPPLAPPPLDGPIPAPPPYEEALRHKVVLSSNYPLPPPAAVPGGSRANGGPTPSTSRLG
ncbi:uncharacterized protein [Hetaerina americana]|uniref:uncharacterized protein n=1 Tax=Hetaerina americana TaxID=62018 RepID=UPI003A7F399F